MGVVAGVPPAGYWGVSPQLWSVVSSKSDWHRDGAITGRRDAYHHSYQQET